MITKNEFDIRGLEILKTLLPNCAIEKEHDTLTVKQGDKTMILKANFKMLFEIIDEDRLSRQQDSAEWYFEQLAKIIEQELSVPNIMAQ